MLRSSFGPDLAPVGARPGEGSQVDVLVPAQVTTVRGHSWCFLTGDLGAQMGAVPIHAVSSGLAVAEKHPAL